MRWVWTTILGLLLAGRAWGYVDYTPTLGRILQESEQVTLVEVEKFSPENRAVILRKVQDLRGRFDAERMKHQITDGEPPRPPREILEWARPGARAVAFINDRTCLVCIGRHWYQAHPSRDGWWRMSLQRSDLPLAYCGSVPRLADAVRQMLAGNEAVITTLGHGANGVGACFDVAFNRTDLAGSRGLQRIKASLRMPPMVCYVSANPAFLVGMGAADAGDVPALLAALDAKDPSARLAAIDDLGALESAAQGAARRLESLLANADAPTALHAAAALLQISPGHAGAVDRLARATLDPNPRTRKLACDSAALAAAAARPLLDRLIPLLADPDAAVKLSALQAIASIGPSAAPATQALVRLLEDPSLRCDAADALGRIGPGARAAGPALARLMNADDSACKWAAVRALVQIGGPDARVVVPFLVEQCDEASRGRDLYNISVYLGLLGPIAREAMPALQRGLHRDRELCAMALWGVDPEQKFPWQWGYTVDREIDRWLFEAYIREMGERAKGSAVALAKAIVAGTAGRPPSWGYQLLIDYPQETVPLLEAGLKSRTPRERQAAIRALGQMGRAARSARPAMEAAQKESDARTQALIGWALLQIGTEPKEER